MKSSLKSFLTIMSSNAPREDELGRLLTQVLSETPTVVRRGEETGAGGITSGGRVSGARFVTEGLGSNLARVNRLTISDVIPASQSDLGAVSGTSPQRAGNSLFVDIGQAGSGSEGGLQMLSARSSGSSTIDSVLDVTPLKYDVYQFPLSLEETAALCGQRQSGGITACVRANCKYNHRGPKVAFRPGSIVVAKSSMSVFIEPCTHHTNISSELYKQWKCNPSTLDEWADVFQLVNAQGPAEVFTPESLVAAQTFQQYAKDFRSPSRSVGLDELPFGEKSTSFARLLNEESERALLMFQLKKKENEAASEGRLMGYLLTGEVDAGDAFGRLELETEMAKAVIKAALTKLDDTADLVNEELRVLFARAQTLESGVGQRVPTSNPAFDAPTLWGSIALLAASLDTLQRDTTELASATAVAFTDLEKGLSGSFENQLQEVVVNATVMVADQMTHAMDAVAASNRRLDAVHESLIMMARGTNKLKDEIADVRDAAEKFTTFMDDGPIRTSSTYSTKDSTMSTDISTLKMLVKALGAQMDTVIDGRERRAVKFFGQTFRGHHEAEAWVGEFLDNDSFGLIVDAHLVFEHVYHQAFSDEGSLKDLNVLYKIKIDNITQGLAISSFDNPMPKFLSISTNTLTKKPKIKKVDSSHFDNIDNYEDWDLPIMGFRAKLKEHLEEFEESHIRMIQELLSVEDPAYRVATMSVQTSVGWIHNFISYLDETYMDTSRLQSFTSARAWQLVTQIGRRILTDVASPRNGIKKLFRIGDNAHIAQAMIWPMIQAHEVMARFKKASFKDDPSVSNEFMKFMATNSGSTDGITGLNLKITKLENDLKDAIKTVKGATTSGATASNRVDEVKKLLTTLGSRVAALERK